jgi:putative DNA primase/helicase
MNFHEFAADHGLIIDRIESGRWVRVPTVSKPHKRNGAYFYDTDYGHVQDWALMDKCVSWREDKPMTPYDLGAQRKRMEVSRKESLIERRKLWLWASRKASTMISSARTDTHGYLKEKGFPEATALVLDGVSIKGEDDKMHLVDNVLLIPMRDLNTNDVLGVQQIYLFDNEWQKKMIFGMRAKGAVFRIGNKTARETFLVEGYSTGLSVDAALRMSRLNASVLVCFSSNNIVHVAPLVCGPRFIFADNDKPDHKGRQAGEHAALAAGLPYCMSDELGEDANDLMRRSGKLAVLNKIMAVRSLMT